MEFHVSSEAVIASWNVADFSVRSNCLKRMVTHVSWFAKIDYPIFVFFDNYDIRATPKVVAGNIQYDRSYTGKRLRALRDAGLLIQDDEGFYTISDLGRDFLAGDLAKEELEALDPKKTEDDVDES
ncbi:phage repressor protein [Haladaptatus sp. CMAA 1911]|uniref:phage repressor protein n=1 Tax=unclassified Haladaptatus TaxID=2622732 RepID=UPI0037544368